MDFAYSPSAGNATFPTWAESFSAPSVTSLTSSPSSTGGGSNTAQWGQAIGMLGEGLGNAVRAFRGEPPMPGGLIQSYMNQQQSDREMQQLKDLFASMGLNAPTLVKPKTEDDEEEKDEEEDDSYSIRPLSALSGVSPLPESFGGTSGYTEFPSPRLAGQALSGYFNTGI